MNPYELAMLRQARIMVALEEQIAVMGREHAEALKAKDAEIAALREKSPATNGKARANAKTAAVADAK